MKKCTRCNSELNDSELINSEIVWLEFSETDGNFYVNVPDGFRSSGYFPFGISCFKKELESTKIKIELESAKTKI